MVEARTGNRREKGWIGGREKMELDSHQEREEK
jgi:hypothetical protein